MLHEVGPKSKAAEGVGHLAQVLSRREAPPPVKAKSLMQKLLKKG
jgi:pilus assembly protein CpaE